MEYQQKDKYTFDDLIEIVKILRAPGGCPWDRAQTHKSIRSNFIEETYEAIEAIDTDDTELLKEELGDVLMQIALHCEMEREAESFDINDVCDGVCKKLNNVCVDGINRLSSAHVAQSTRLGRCSIGMR